MVTHKPACLFVLSTTQWIHFMGITQQKTNSIVHEIETAHKIGEKLIFSICIGILRRQLFFLCLLQFGYIICRVTLTNTFQLLYLYRIIPDLGQWNCDSMTIFRRLRKNYAYIVYPSVWTCVYFIYWCSSISLQ